jgi:hypothetical protein
MGVKEQESEVSTAEKYIFGVNKNRIFFGLVDLLSAFKEKLYIRSWFGWVSCFLSW